MCRGCLGGEPRALLARTKFLLVPLCKLVSNQVISVLTGKTVKQRKIPCPRLSALA